MYNIYGPGDRNDPETSDDETVEEPVEESVEEVSWEDEIIPPPFEVTGDKIYPWE